MLLFFVVFHAALAAENITNAPDHATALSISAIQIEKSQYLPSHMTQSVYEKLTVEQQNELATQWNLSMTEYQRYLWLMEHTTSGVYYQDRHLDPSWILGINASTDQERQKYVAIALKNERERIMKELAFQREFNRLAHLLFPNEKPITWNPVVSK